MLSPILEVLGPDGVLAKTVEGYAVRDQQLEMAEAVDQAIADGKNLIAEAGTGTGKTFSYLVPALLSQRKTIISTGTRNLQDQLFLRDLPRLRDAMASPVKVSLLKGRSNYLCIHRMENAMHDARGHSKEMLAWLLAVRDWSQTTQRGDIAELVDVPEDAQIWPLVTSTTDNCLGQDCPSYSKCHLVEARRQAQEADVVVVNHHLLCADFAIRDTGFGELLPAADVFIIDEAHQLPEVASNFFGTVLSSRQLMELVTDTTTEYHRDIGDLPKILDQLEKLKKSVLDLRLAFGTTQRREAWIVIEDDNKIQDAFDQVEVELDVLKGMLEVIKGRSKGIDACLARCETTLEVITKLRQPEEPDEVIRWFEVFGQSVRWNSTPIDIAKLLW